MRLSVVLVGACAFIALVGCVPLVPTKTVLPLTSRGIADCALNAEYFPEPHLGLNGDVSQFEQGMREWYEVEFRAMHEPSLYTCTRTPQQHVYRLLWARSLSSQPVARLTIAADGTGELELKLLDRECVPPPPGMEIGPCSVTLQQHAITLNRQQTAQAGHLVQTMSWRKSAAQLAQDAGMDGADWFFEERDGDRYRFIDFRQPSTEAAELTRLLFWDWTGFLPDTERRTLQKGFYY